MGNHVLGLLFTKTELDVTFMKAREYTSILAPAVNIGTNIRPVRSGHGSEVKSGSSQESGVKSGSGLGSEKASSGQILTFVWKCILCLCFLAF